MKYINIIGAGLAGAEAAYQLSKRKVHVRLYEQRPIKSTGAHHSSDFAELVCSNSLKSNSLENACGLLKEEMRLLDSLIIKIADENKVDAGQALAVDRDAFSKKITEILKNNLYIEVINEEITKIPEGISIIATGPLTSDMFAKELKAYFGDDDLYFYDAAAPLIEFSSIDLSKCYFKDRYDKGNGDYLNCPFTKEEFDKFYNELIHAERVELHTFEKEKHFEGCMPIEVLASRGPKTLTFGPLKPVGLEKEDGTRPYAVVQLRQDNAAKTLFNMVGFQTNLKYGEQKRVFQMIPGLENAKFARYGQMHRNTYLCSPKILNPTLVSKKNPYILLAGQITGVEGYVESAATGLFAAINAFRLLNNEESLKLPNNTMLGALCNYITSANPSKFQPMNANYGILLQKNDKIEIAKESLASLKEWIIKWKL